MNIKNLYLPKTFWIITLIKLLCGTLFASYYVTKGFLPFIQYFITTGKSPYDHFFTPSHIVFPYPAAMLFIMSIPLYIGHLLFNNLFSIVPLQLFLFHIPILIADIAIYIILCKLLPSKENKVLWLYFASPILFYINYYNGQLDVIPTAILVLSLYFLFVKNYFTSLTTLGIGIVIKSHLFIALPFYIVYLLKKKEKIQNIISASLIPFILFLLFTSQFFTKSYINTVFNNIEQQRLFLVVFPYQYKDLFLLIAPAAFLLSFYKFASLKRVNFDSLILMLGLVFTILIALVPPLQGWFYWSIPLFLFFLIKYKDSYLLSFWMMNVFYILFFIFTNNSDIFESASAVFPIFSSIPIPYQFLQTEGFNALIIQNILFTFLQVSIVMNAYWCYKLGIYYNNLYIEKQNAFVVGIGGDSGVGKSTLTDGIKELAGKNQTVVLNGDDSHKWERNNTNWEYFTHLNPKANNIHKDINQIYALVDGKTIERATYSHKTGKFTKPSLIEKDQFIVFQGLHPFFLERMRNIYNLKIFIDTEEDLRKKWKITRDIKYRGHSITKVAHDIKKRKQDAIKFIHPQKKLADWVIQYYKTRELICVKYTFPNSIPLEELINELVIIKSLKINHQYKDIKIQTVTIEGKINKKIIEEIAYKLYPNLPELINNKADFKENTQGLNQLFFINYLNYFFINNKPITQDLNLN